MRSAIAVAVFVTLLCCQARAQAVDGQPPAAPVPQASDKNKPIPPGGMRITTRPPEPGKWDFQIDQKSNVRTYTCKPLACADSSRVTIAIQRSPTLHPDPAALEKLAKVDLPKSIRAGSASLEVMSDGTAKAETLVGKTAQLKGYAAVLNETKMTLGKKTLFMNVAIIFAGPTMLRLTSVSPLRPLAQKSLDEYVEALIIEAGPPLPVTPGPNPVPVPLTPSPSTPQPPPRPAETSDTPQRL
jgi:hypothetical protein